MVYGDCVDWVSDRAMTEFLAKHCHLVGQKGTPDATVLADGVSLFDTCWGKVRFLQVCRAYDRIHLHAMIRRKITYSQLFLNALAATGKVFQVTDFVIGIFVPSHLMAKAEKIVSHPRMMMTDTVFRVVILDAGSDHDLIFDFVPPLDQLRRVSTDSPDFRKGGVPKPVRDVWLRATECRSDIDFGPIGLDRIMGCR